jgi:hypothetical protein
MKSRENISIAAGLVVILSCFGFAGTVSGQGYAPGGPPPGYYYQPPSMAPTGPSMYPGVFYIGGGAKVRDLQTLSIGTKNAQLTNIIVQGSPAFGPNVPGSILYPVPPTALGTDNPNISGIWSYDDGFIEPTGTSGTVASVNYPSGALAGLGKFVAGEDSGSFRIFDFHVQANDAGSGSMSNTTALNWSKLLSGLTPGTTDFMLHFICAQPASGTGTSCFPALPCPGPTACTYPGPTGTVVNGGEQAAATTVAGATYYNESASGGFAASTDAGAANDFDNRVWAPYIEFGFQSTALFDVFYGVSAFQASRTFSETRSTIVPFARRGFRDTFGFQSSDPAVWSVGNFWSVGGTDGQSYFIYPNDGSAQPVPNRAFFNAVDVTVPGTPAQESITAQLDFTTIESRSGGRAWIPLWGMGRMGTSFGGLAAATTATLTSSALYVATAASPPLVPGGAPLRLAGDVLVNSSGTTKSSLWNFGIFCAADLELGFSRIFVKSAIEYNYYFYGTIVESDIIATKVNLSGAAATISGGLRF